MNRSGPLYALMAAALFGLAAPASKMLVGAVEPWLLAGLLYTGSGVGLALSRIARAARGTNAEEQLSRAELPWLAGAIAFGGVVAPVLLMVGLARTEASAASLLLTLEGAATALIAWFIFRENFDRRIALGMALISAGAVVLVWRNGLRLSDAIGPLAIVGACVAWGIDNNLTRKVALADPVQIAMLKGLIAGPVNLFIAFAGGARLPAFEIVAMAAAVGLLGYGVSLVFFVIALRHLGTARTGAYFATAPFLGAAAAIPLLGEPLSVQLVSAGLLMGIGVWLHLTERHAHEHEHEPMEHGHRHIHDEHHQHVHDPGDPSGEPHSHRHVHVRLRHTHAHTPDSHHRHVH
jgi:drug/metabolite transporter (DMT)-like permease